MAKRFVKTYGQGVVESGAEICVDQASGVNCLFVWSAGGGLTPLPDTAGKPVITRVEDMK